MPALGGTFRGVVLDSRAIAKNEREWPGLLRYQLVIGEAVKVEAQRRVGVYRIPPQGPIRQRKPGTLRDSIVKRITSRDGLPVVQVGSEDPIALIHHEGTQPHVILPRRGSRLVFWSDQSNRLVFAKQINHPGTRPNRFLVDALAVIGRSQPR